MYKVSLFKWPEDAMPETVFVEAESPEQAKSQVLDVYPLGELLRTPIDCGTANAD